MQPQPGGVETLGYGSECLYAFPMFVSLPIPKWFPLLKNGGNHFGVSRCSDQHGRPATLTLQAAGASEIWNETDDTCHLNGTARMGDDPRTSVVDADCRSWDIPNLWICDGSVFPTVGGVNPSLTIQAIACRTADRIEVLAARGELDVHRNV
jgi:choline dehydrogenase-like flavoprotein